MSAVPLSTDNGPLKELMGKVDQLAVLPQVVFKVLELTDSLDSPAQEMERAIIIDPGFSSKVLVLANSASLGLPRRVTSIKEAIMFLGYKQVRSLAMTIGVFDLFVGKNDRESLRRRKWWRQSVDTAVCCRWLAQTTRKVNGDDSYTCGLLHLIGKTLMDRYGNKDYHIVTEMTDFGVEDTVAERHAYGIDHVQVAVAAAQKWGFPELLWEGMNYRMPEDAGHPFRAQQACTAVGHAIAGAATSGASRETSALEQLIPAWALEELGLAGTDLVALFEGGNSAISATQLHF